MPIKLFKQLDLASDPVATPFQSFLDAALAKSEDAVTGIYQVTSSTQLPRVHLLMRYPDGKTDKWDWSLATRSDIKAFRDYVKSLEKAAEKK